MRSTPLALLAAMILLTACTKSSEPPPAKEAAQPPSDALSGAKRDPNRAYCSEHKAYEDQCFFCHGELREKGRLWCNEHNRYEDRCWICHPEQQDKKRIFCGDHFLYEDECGICHSGPEPKSESSTQSVPAARLMCREHDVYEDECGICHPELAAGMGAGRGVKIRMPSRESAAKAGIETALPQVGPMADGIECYAELAFDQNKLARIAAPVGGILHSVEADVGLKVEAGSCLAKIWSADIGEAVARALLTRQTLERERKLRADNISSEKELQEAAAAYQAAYQNVRTLGFDDADIAVSADDPARIAVLPLRAPFAGELIERNAVRGARVEAGAALFTLADRSTMWAMLNVPEEHLEHIRLNQPVELRFDALPGHTFTGRLTWIAAQLDERTRMVGARAEVPNPDGRLRARMFAQARVLTGRSDRAVIVPQAAVQHIERRAFTFVKVADGLYEARSVRLGSTRDGRVEILAGVSHGEPVVVANAFVVKSQLLISRLGAGCVD